VQTIHLEDTVARIPNGASLAIGGFMAFGTPERLIDELVRQQKRHLTVLANDTAMPGKGIGKLIGPGWWTASSSAISGSILKTSGHQIQSFPARLHVIQQAGLIWWGQR